MVVEHISNMTSFRYNNLISIASGSWLYASVSKLNEHKTQGGLNMFMFHKNRFTSATYFLTHGGQHSINILKER